MVKFDGGADEGMAACEPDPDEPEDDLYRSIEYEMLGEMGKCWDCTLRKQIPKD